MRLLVVSQYFWPEVFRVNELVEQLTARGHDVTVLTGQPNYPEGVIFPRYRQSPGAFSQYAGARVVRLPMRPRGRGSIQLLLNYWSFVFWGILLGPWLLKGQRYDAIFVFETSPITSALPAVLLRRIKGAPLALWVLDLWPDTLSAVGVVRSKLGLALVGQLVSFIYRRCDVILAQSRAFFAPIDRWARAPHKIRYFPQWSEGLFAESCVPASETAPELEPYAGRFKILFAGNLGDAQDLPSVLAAASRLKARSDIQWLLLGDGRAADVVRNSIAQQGLQDRVAMLGRHPLERMPAFFAGADALLVSLRAEPIFALTIPGKVQSYLAAGKPILAMLDGEGARVIRDAGAGLSGPASDPDALAHHAQMLADMPADERLKMGQAGRDYARREFDREQLITELEGWLRQLKMP